MHMHALISKDRLKPTSQAINIYDGGEEEPANQLIELHKSDNLSERCTAVCLMN